MRYESALLFVGMKITKCSCRILQGCVSRNSEFVVDMVVPGTRVVLKFPVRAHVVDSFEGDSKLCTENKGINAKEVSNQIQKALKELISELSGEV